MGVSRWRRWHQTNSSGFKQGLWQTLLTKTFYLCALIWVVAFTFKLPVDRSCSYIRRSLMMEWNAVGQFMAWESAGFCKICVQVCQIRPFSLWWWKMGKMTEYINFCYLQLEIKCDESLPRNPTNFMVGEDVDHWKLLIPDTAWECSVHDLDLHDLELWMTEWSLPVFCVDWTISWPCEVTVHHLVSLPGRRSCKRWAESSDVISAKRLVVKILCQSSSKALNEQIHKYIVCSSFDPVIW